MTKWPTFLSFDVQLWNLDNVFKIKNGTNRSPDLDILTKWPTFLYSDENQTICSFRCKTDHYIMVIIHTVTKQQVTNVIKLKNRQTDLFKDLFKLLFPFRKSKK
jgi:hypothetical protein